MRSLTLYKTQWNAIISYYIDLLEELEPSKNGTDLYNCIRDGLENLQTANQKYRDRNRFTYCFAESSYHFLEHVLGRAIQRKAEEIDLLTSDFKGQLKLVDLVNQAKHIELEDLHPLN